MDADSAEVTLVVQRWEGFTRTLASYYFGSAEFDW
jgi:hypothetical protein